MKTMKKGYHKTKSGKVAKKGLYYNMNKRKKAGTSRPGKGTVSSKVKTGTFSASTTPTPGTGKGKARGLGEASSGGKFSGIY